MVNIADQRVRQVLEDLIILNESGSKKHPKVYLDSKGIKTIGHGFNLERQGARDAITGVGADYNRILNGKDSLTDAQIMQLFEPDVDNAIAGARRVVSSFDKLNAERQIIIVDMVFNMGEGGLARFVAMLPALNKGDFEVAADEMQKSDWFSQVGKRAVRNVASMRSGKLESTEYSKFQQAIDKLRSSTGTKAQKDAKDGKDSAKETKEGKDGKEASKEGKDRKDGKDGAKERKEGKETKEGKDGKEASKDSKDGKDATKETKEGKDGKEASKDSKDGKDGTKERKETKDGKETKEGKDGKEASKESKDGKDGSKETKEGKEGKDGPDVSPGFPEWPGAALRNPTENDLPSWNRYSV